MYACEGGRDGRVVDGGGLENHCTRKRYRGFESLSLRQISFRQARHSSRSQSRRTRVAAKADAASATRSYRWLSELIAGGRLAQRRRLARSDHSGLLESRSLTTSGRVIRDRVRAPGSSPMITAHRSHAAQSGARSGLARAARGSNLPTLVTTCGHRVMGDTESRASGAPLARSSPGRWPDADSDSGTPD